VELPNEDLAKLFDMIKAYVNEKGGLPSPTADREIWEEVDALVSALKSLNYPVSLKELADELGVSYSSFMKYYKAYQRTLESNEKEEELPKVEVSKPKPSEESKEESEANNSGSNKAEASGSTPAVPQEQRVFETTTKAEILRRIRQKFIRTAEPLTEQHVEMLVGLGERFYENYGNQCIQNGYEKLEDCMDDAMDALFNKMPEYEYLKEQFDKLADAGAKLLLKLAEYAKRVQDLELIEKILTGEIDEELEAEQEQEDQSDDTP